MSLLMRITVFLCCTINFITIDAAIQRKNVAVEELNENNWDRMLTGEWMVEFFAPWCPACKELEPTWSYLGDIKDKLSINVGKVDVTDSPGLSGRFMVTALPTIYHVKDGIFRQYKSPRDQESLVNFVKAKTWMKVEPISSWKSPTSLQMSIISQFFKMSQVLRAIHNQLMEDYGLPTWGSYLIFAVATIIIGAILGLVIVCVIDFVYPPKPARSPAKMKKDSEKDSSESSQEKVSDDEEEELVNSINDDLEDDDDGTDTEKQQENNKKNLSAANSPNARKRKTRKAD